MNIKNKYLNTTWLREDIKQRDGEECFLCGKTSSLSVHHICGREAYPFLMNDSDTTVLLCRACHHDYHQHYDEVNPVTWTKWLMKKRTQVSKIKIELRDGSVEEVPLDQDLIRKSKDELMNDDINVTILSVLAYYDFTEEELIDYILSKYNTTENTIRAGIVKLKHRKRLMTIYEEEHGEVLKAVAT